STYTTKISHISLHDALPIFELQDGTVIKPSDYKKTIAEPDVLPIVYNYVIAGEDVISQLGEPENVEQHVAWQDKDADEEASLSRSEEHTSELQSRFDLVCRL